MTRIFILFFFFFSFLQIQAQNPDAVLANHTVEIQIENNKLHKYVSYELRINNRTGDKYGNIEIPYSKIIKVSNIQAFVRDKHGNIIKKLKRSDIRERSAISDYSFYEDDWVKEFTLRHNIYPYTIIYSYETKQDEFLSIDYWVPIVDIDVPTINAKLHIELPKDYSIFYKEQLVNKAKIEINEINKNYTWETTYDGRFESEIASPPIYNYLPEVIVVPDNFKYSIKGSFKDWVSFGEWQSQLIKNLSDLNEIEKNKILSLVEGISDEKEKIKTLYYYLQDNTRYINVSIETGGLKPYPASYVAKNKYGDCKALSNYFKAVLDVVGVKSYYTKVKSGDQIHEIDKNFPSQQFDHIILYVPLLNDTVWLDCTSKGPFNYLGTFTQNREVFIINNEKSHFKRTPALTFPEVLEKRNIKISPAENLKANTFFKCVYKGENYEILHSLLKYYNETERQHFVREHIVESSLDLKNYYLNEEARDSAKIKLEYNAETAHLYKQYGNEIIIKVLPIYVPKFEKVHDRKLPVQINYPTYKIDTLEYELINGYRISGILRDKEIETKYGRYKIEYHLKNNSVQIVKLFLLNSGSYSVNEYEGLFQFINQIKTIENNSYIVIEKEK